MNTTSSRGAASGRRSSAHAGRPLMQPLEGRMLLSAGVLDTTFATAGRAVFNVGTTGYGADAVAVQADGKILILGHSSPAGRENIVLMRLTSKGALDTTFASRGTVTIGVAGVYFQPHAIAVQSDGKILVGGAMGRSTGTGDFLLMRLNANGGYDTAFGARGILVTPFAAGPSEISAIGFQYGKIVVSGSLTGAQDFAVARYSMSGQLDGTFGTSGRVVTDMNGGGDLAYSLAVQSDGKILVGGNAAMTSGPYTGLSVFGIARYTINGQLDPTFSGTGKAFVKISGTDSADDLIVQRNGCIVAGGRSGPAGQQFGMARLLVNGALDTTFGGKGTGKVLTPLATAMTGPGTMVAQADGKIVVSGVAVSATMGQRDFAVERFSSGGVADATFGRGSVAITDFGGDDYMTRVAIQPTAGLANGKIILFGLSDKSAKENFGVARFLTA